jgi:hypothetical protein
MKAALLGAMPSREQWRDLLVEFPAEEVALVSGPLLDPRVRDSVRTCGVCPEQYEGTLVDGREFYFRYRYGMATLGLGKDRFGEALRYVEHGDDLQGEFEDEATREDVLGRLLDETDPEFIAQVAE